VVSGHGGLEEGIIEDVGLFVGGGGRALSCWWRDREREVVWI
jgi:hypothetical protein